MDQTDMDDALAISTTIPLLLLISFMAYFDVLTLPNTLFSPSKISRVLSALFTFFPHKLPMNCFGSKRVT